MSLFQDSPASTFPDLKTIQKTVGKMSRHLTLVFVILLLVMAASQTAHAQGMRARGVKVLGVRVEGTVTADQGLVLANSGLVVGKEITGDDIQRAIRRIWGLNLFRQVEILMEREVVDGAFFVIYVQEYPRIHSVEVVGNDKIKDDKIDEILELYRGQVIRPSRLQRIKRKLLDEYKDKGYLLAEVEFDIQDAEEEMRKNIRVNIEEGKKVRISEIAFLGNEAFKDKTLRKQFEETHERGLFRSGSFDRDEFEADLELMLGFYRNHGYRDAEVLRDSIEYTDNLERMNIFIEVREGTKYTFGDIRLEGNTLFTDEELLVRMAFEKGDEYSEEKLQVSTTERLGNAYYDRGYIYSRIEPTLIPVADDTLDVYYNIHEGNQFTVRKINVLGNTKTNEKVIRREFVLYPGDTFDVSRLRRSVRELTILNYFSNVVPDVQPVNDSQVDLYVEVEEKPTDQANVSAGYSERDGVIGAIGFSMPNFLGNGQSLSLDWNFGSIYRSFSISYTEPWMFNTPTLGGVSLFDLRRGGSYYGYDEHVTGLSLRLGRRFKWPDDYTRGDWIYRVDRSLYDNFTANFAASNPRSLQEGKTRWSSSLTQIFTRDSRNNPEFPSRGSVFYYSAELTGSVLGGDDQFHKHILNGEWYFPLTSKLVLYSQTKYGLLFGTGDDQDIPYIDYFFMGGSGISFGESMRGYEEGDVGPQSGGYPVGGKSMFKQTFELRVPIIPNPTVFLLGFAEAGNTWASREATDLNNLRRSMGVGVRLFMPFIGMIGLDYGYGFDYIDSTGRRSGKWKPHFQFGRTF